jgi:large subunit ribosomal protein L6
VSRIGKKLIELPKGVEAKIQGQLVTIKGPKGTLSFTMHEGISAALEGTIIKVACASEEKFYRSLFGMTRKMVANMVQGVSTGFEKNLELNGVGYRAEKQGRNLSMSMGFSHPVVLVPPEGIEIAVDKQTKIKVTGADRQKVGQMAALIRGVREVEPYKGKGVKYDNEIVRRKAGKAAKSAGAGAAKA